MEQETDIADQVARSGTPADRQDQTILKTTTKQTSPIIKKILVMEDAKKKLVENFLELGIACSIDDVVSIENDGDTGEIVVSLSNGHIFRQRASQKPTWLFYEFASFKNNVNLEYDE